MLDWTNSVACVLLLVLTFPIAVVMNPSAHWPQRLALITIIMLLAAQAVSPVYDFIPPANALQTISNLVVLAVVLSARKEIMGMVHRTIGEHATKDGHPMTRAEDRSQASEIDHQNFARVHGRGTD